MIAMVFRWFREQRLLKENPESWRTMKAAEEDTKEREAQRRERLAKGGLGLLGIFLKRR
jgi:hypothetical protein